MSFSIEYIVLEEGLQVSESILTVDQLRNVVTYSSSVSQKRSSLISEDQEDVFYLLRNSMNGLYDAFILDYWEADQIIQNNFANLFQLLLVLLLLGLLVPSFAYAIVLVFCILQRSKMTAFLDSLGFLRKEEIEKILLKVQWLKKIFQDSNDEKDLKRDLMERKITRTVDTRRSAKRKSKSENHKRIQSSKKASYYRFPQLAFTFLGMISGVASVLTVFYLLEATKIDQLEFAVTLKQAVLTQFLSENLLYSTILAYIGQGVEAEVLQEAVTLTLEEALKDQSHSTFVEDYLVEASEKKASNHLYDILDDMESSDLCQKYLSDVAYCEEYGDGVYKEGLATSIQFTNTELRSAIEEFKSSEMGLNDQKSAFRSTILSSLVYFAEKCNERLFEYLIEKLTEEINAQMEEFIKIHYSIMTVCFFILLGITVSVIKLANQLMTQDQVDIKQVFTLIHTSCFLNNKYMRIALIRASPKTEAEMGTKCMSLEGGY